MKKPHTYPPLKLGSRRNSVGGEICASQVNKASAGPLQPERHAQLFFCFLTGVTLATVKVPSLMAPGGSTRVPVATTTELHSGLWISERVDRQAVHSGHRRAAERLRAH